MNTITGDQERLRKNLREMPSTAKAYKRYLEKFDQQETEIETYESQIKQLNGRADQERRDYEEYLANVNVE